MRLVAAAGEPPTATAIEWATIRAPAGLAGAVLKAIAGTTIAVAAIVGACSFQNR